jgi:hypothetical protein
MIFIKPGTKRKRHGDKSILVLQDDFSTIDVKKNAAGEYWHNLLNTGK